MQITKDDVGKKIWSVEYGWGEIIGFKKYLCNPVNIRFEKKYLFEVSYTIRGCTLNVIDLNPVKHNGYTETEHVAIETSQLLFWEEMEIKPKQ